MTKEEFISRVLELKENYQPNIALTKELNQIDLVAIVGPTGVGKTTVMKSLNLPIVRSDVTRNRRTDEVSSDEYIFRNDYEAMLKQLQNGEYIQFVVSGSGDFYGTRRDSFPKNGVCLMAIIAKVIPQFKSLGFKKVATIYILPPSYDEWMRRVGEKRDKDLQTRLTEAKASLQLALQEPSYIFIVNDKIESAVADIRRVITGGNISRERLQIATQIAQQLSSSI